jgi:hypothetical protein
VFRPVFRTTAEFTSRDRQKRSLAPVSVLLSDIHPHTAAWERLSAASQSGSLSSIPYPVDATRAPSTISEQRHFRTFCLAFHHFDEQGAGRVLEDAMRTGEGIGCVIQVFMHVNIMLMAGQDL